MVKNNKFLVEQLVLEVTRKCNMTCKHCLRGPAENVDMTKEIVDKTFANIESVSSLVFTGGEPFMNVDIIEYALEVVKTKEIPVFELFLVTNAKVVKDRYIKVLNDWMLYVAICNCGDRILTTKSYLPDTEDMFSYGGVAISRDKFHDPIPMENYIRYRMLSYYSDIKEHKGDEFKNIRNEGNAKINGIGTYNPERNIVCVDYSILDNLNGVIISDLRVEGNLYINVKGDVLGDCDVSYVNQKSISIGNILEMPLINLLEKVAITQENLDYDECIKKVI